MTAKVVCGKRILGLYGTTTACARPEGHVGKHDPIWKHKDWQRTEEPSDDEGLEPIETSPLTEREPDL